MKTLSDFGISKADEDLLLSALYNGAINLLTGAGASYDVIGGDNVKLKGGQDLARELNLRFCLSNEEPDCSNLRLVYGDIAAIQAQKKNLAEFLSLRFTNCVPTWQAKLFSLPWKRIWTLNIDDVLQKATPSSFRRQVSTYTWVDKLQVRSFEEDALQIIHLHGRANKGDKDLHGIIFSMHEYASRVEISPGWHAEFRSEFAKKPFVICGSRLREEFDLETVLNFGNHSRTRGGCPSFIVLHDYSAGEENRFKRYGLIPIKATGEAFFSSLGVAYQKYIELISDSQKPSRRAEVHIHSRFRKLDLVDGNKNKLGKLFDYYSGAEAQWGHIVAGNDAIFPRLDELKEWLCSTENDARALLFVGGPVSGKTTFALRLAYELAVSDYIIWEFRGEENFEPDQLLDYLASEKPAILVFDDCADVSGALSKLLLEATSRKTRVRLIATANKLRYRGVQRDLDHGKLSVIQIEPLAHEAFDAVFSKRSEKGRLGRCTGSSASDAWKDFKAQYNMKFLDWLESLEGASWYQLALSRIFDDGVSEHALFYQLIIATAATHRFGFSLPFEIADIISGNQVIDFDNEDNCLREIAYIDEKGIRLRSKAFSMRVWGKVPSNEKYDLLLFLVKRLSPLVVPQTIARRTYAYRLLRELMDCDAISRDLGEEANAWYEELLPLLRWNSRYWEQRALLCMKNKEDGKAYSYAKEAVQRQPRDAFPHTTLGVVCLKISIRRADNTGLERFWEGVESLDVSRKFAVENGTEWEHPYVTFFTHAIRALPLYPQATNRFTMEWEGWMQKAKKSKLFDPDQLKEYQADWLRLAVSRKP